MDKNLDSLPMGGDKKVYHVAKKKVLLVVGIFLFVCTPLLPAQTKDASPPQQEKTVGIDEVVKAVGEALKEAQA